jgi:hypothetical protein
VSLNPNRLETDMAEVVITTLDLAAAAIVRNAQENPNLTVAGLQDELERGDIEAWGNVVRRYSLTFSGWSGAMERAIAILETRDLRSRTVTEA